MRSAELCSKESMSRGISEVTLDAISVKQQQILHLTLEFKLFYVNWKSCEWNFLSTFSTTTCNLAAVSCEWAQNKSF